MVAHQLVQQVICKSCIYAMRIFFFFFFKLSYIFYNAMEFKISIQMSVIFLLRIMYIAVESHYFLFSLPLWSCQNEVKHRKCYTGYVAHQLCIILQSEGRFIKKKIAIDP